MDRHGHGLSPAAERYNLSTFDAMIAASALHADCETSWSEDGHLRIANPFLPTR